MNEIKQTSKAENGYKNWKEIYEFITTAKNYHGHALSPDGDLDLKGLGVVRFGQTIYKKKKQLVLWNHSAEAVNDILIERDKEAIQVESKVICPLTKFLERQKEWSIKTFGNSKRTLGIIRHIEKELKEVEEKPNDLTEWIDVIILALDGYWRHGGNTENIMNILQAKQDNNFTRVYPFPKSEDEPSEHIRGI